MFWNAATSATKQIVWEHGPPVTKDVGTKADRKAPPGRKKVGPEKKREGALINETRYTVREGLTSVRVEVMCHQFLSRRVDSPHPSLSRKTGIADWSSLELLSERIEEVSQRGTVIWSTRQDGEMEKTVGA